MSRRFRSAQFSESSLSLSPFSDLPKSGPDILGGHPRYNIGDRVNVTCASRNSLPAADLSWYINGEKADQQFLLYYPEEESYSGLRTAKLGLSFKVRKEEFATSHPRLLLYSASCQSVRCQAGETVCR